MVSIKPIAESINIMGKRSGTAMKAREAGPVQEMAREEAKAGAGFLDLNIGPARKDGIELMPWIVETVQSVVDTPLCLDTTNTDAMAAGFKVVKNKTGALMNSISAQPERMEKLIPVAAEAGCNVVALLWGPDGMPRDSNERAAMAVDLMMALSEAGIPNEKMFFDPIATPITLGCDQIRSGLEFMSMVQDIAPGASSTIGLSNVSNGVAEHLQEVPRPHLPDHADVQRPADRHRQLLRPGADGHRPGPASEPGRHDLRHDRRQRPRSGQALPDRTGALQDLQRPRPASRCSPSPG